jgi:pilus assembly protein Flp/PilA
MSIITRLYREESAQGMVEYALLAGLIAVVAIAAVIAVGGNVSSIMNNIATQLGAGS